MKMKEHKAPLCIQFMQTAKPTQQTVRNYSTGTIIIKMCYIFKYSEAKTVGETKDTAV